MLIPADMRQPKPGLELSFQSNGMGIVGIEAHSERARKWLEHRFGKVTESSGSRLTKEIPNLGGLLCLREKCDEIEAEASKLGLVTQWNPASQEEIDFERASRRSAEAKRSAAAHPNENTPLFCSRCGTKNPEDSANCFNCGRNMTAPSDTSELGSGSGANGCADHDVAQALKDQASKLNDENYLHAALIAPVHLFFFTAVDLNGVIRFFDIMQGKNVYSVAETATSAPRLARCRETVFEVPSSDEFHHVHRNYGSYDMTDTLDASTAMLQFAKACGLTQVVKTAETLNHLQARPTWDMIFERLGCTTREFSFKSVSNFTE